MKILALEDSAPKWKRVETVIHDTLGSNVEIRLARDLYEGEPLVQQSGWDLLILDISLDIRSGAGRGGRGAHDYTGGLKIASRMFYEACEIPTVIITGFDAFPSSTSQEDSVILGLEDVDRQARAFLKDYLLKTLRIGAPGWDAELAAILRQVADK